MYYDRNVGQVGLSAARAAIRLMLLRICETAWRGLHVIRESVQELSPKGFFKRVRLRGRNREHETSRIRFRHILSLNSITCVPHLTIRYIPQSTKRLNRVAPNS